MTHETEVSWAAGFFDGEGTVWSRIVPYRAVRLAVGQSATPELLERFRLAVGGVGNVRGPYQPKSPNHRPRSAAPVSILAGIVNDGEVTYEFAAEECLRQAAGLLAIDPAKSELLAAAQVFATLAVAHQTARSGRDIARAIADRPYR